MYTHDISMIYTLQVYIPILLMKSPHIRVHIMVLSIFSPPFPHPKTVSTATAPWFWPWWISTRSVVGTRGRWCSCTAGSPDSPPQPVSALLVSHPNPRHFGSFSFKGGKCNRWKLLPSKVLVAQRANAFTWDLDPKLAPPVVKSCHFVSIAPLPLWLKHQTSRCIRKLTITELHFCSKSLQ